MTLKKFLLILVPVLLIASVWGYFVDLRYGEIGWFFVRVAVSTLVAVAFAFWLGPNKLGDAKLSGCSRPISNI